MTHHPSRFLLAMTIAASLGGCFFVGDGKSALDAYIGRPVADYAAVYGPPGSSVKWSEHQTSFSWDTVGRPLGPAIGSIVGSADAVAAAPTVCTVSLIATTQSPKPELKDWTVQAWYRQGSC